MAEPVIRLVGEINEENVSEVIEKLGRLSHNADRVALLVDSDGGSVEEGLRLIDAIRIIQNKGVTVKAVVTGRAYSMSAFVICAAKERTAYPNARIMMHCARYDGLSESESYSAEDLKVLYKEMEYTDGVMRGILINAGVNTNDATLLMSKKDTYFSIPQAIHMGIIHKIEDEII
jgi:ATP-dependent protease ClpP protease subunit